jgi:uncharacterized protein YcfJ
MKKILLTALLSISLAGCISNPNTLALGAIGGLGGGALGSMVGAGKGRLAATAAGSLLGALTGGYVGNRFDGVTANARAINALANRPAAAAPATSVMPMPMAYPVATPMVAPNAGYSLPMTCSLRNNYVVCNGR